MNQELCRATVIYVGIGKDGKIKCFLTKESQVPAAQNAFHVTIVVLWTDANVGENTRSFNSFEEAQNWLEKHFDELSIVELKPIPKATN